MRTTRRSLAVTIFSTAFTALVNSLATITLCHCHFHNGPFIDKVLFIIVVSPSVIVTVSLLILFVLLNVRLNF